MQIKTKDTTCQECDKYGLGFKNLAEHEMLILNSNKNKLKFAAGEIIIKQDALLDYVYFLRDGLVKVVIESENQRNIILEIIAPCQFIGLALVNVSEFSPVSLVALTDCYVCQIRKTAVQDIMKNNSSFHDQVLKLYNSEFYFLFKKITTLGSRNSHGRLSEALLYLDSERFKERDVYSFLTRKELAELASISVESMNKILKEFKNDLIIDIDEKNIALLRPDLLERISRVG